MIKYLRHHYLDKEKYDQCVRQHRPALIYGYSWYLDTVCETWDALVLNDYDAVWPLPVGHKYGFTYYYVPYGVQQLGIYSKKDLEASHFEAFLKELRKQVLYADLNLNYGHQLPSSFSKGISFTERCNLVLDLRQPYQKIFENYNSSLRQKIRKLENTKLQLFEHDGPDVLIALFRENQGKKFKPSNNFYLRMNQLMYRMMHRSCGKIFTVYGGPNQLMAGAFFGELNGRSTIIFNAQSAWGKSENALTYLINEYIINRSEKLHILDFEGSNNPGIAQYYSSFGAENQNYYNLKHNLLPRPLRWLKK